MSNSRALGATLALMVGLAPMVARADGVVGQMRVDPHGRVTGVILQDGTEIVPPPAQREALLQRVGPGDRVRTALGPAASFQIWDARTAQFVDLGSNDQIARGGGPVPAVAVPYARVDDARSLTPLEVDGRVALITHPPNGDPSGFVMANGAQVYVVPSAQGMLRDVHAGDSLRVSGRGTVSEHGEGLWAMSITRPDRLVLLDMTRGIGAPELGLGRAR